MSHYDFAICKACGTGHRAGTRSASAPCAPHPAPASHAGAPRAPIPAAAGDTCVEPVGVMRREHMHMLMHQRDRTVHEAYRDKQHSLRGCVECHTNRTAEGQTIAVNADGQFCQACHAYAAVKMDCFECHATTPDSGRRGSGARR